MSSQASSRPPAEATCPPVNPIPPAVTEAPLRAARVAVGAMFFILGATVSNWLARIPAVQERLHLNDRALGWALLGTTGGALIAFRGAGYLLGRFGSRRINRLAVGALTLLLPLPTLAYNAISLTGALICSGMAGGLMDVAMNAQAVEVEKRSGKPILSALHGLFSLGGLVGAALGSAAATLDIPPHWHLAAVGVLTFTGALAAGGKLLPFEGRALAPPKATRRQRWLQHRGLWALGALAFCSSVGEGAMGDWAAVYMREILHTTMGTAALAYSAYSLTMLTGRFLGDRITTHLGPRPVVRTGGIIVALGMGGGLLINTVPAMLAAVMLVGMGLSVVVPVVLRAAGQMPGLSPGAALATLATLSYSGFLVGPPAIGFVSHYFTLRGGLAVVVLLAVMLTLLAPFGLSAAKQPHPLH